MVTPDRRQDWAAALDLQKHFNDILFRVRSLAFAGGGVAAAVAGAKLPDLTQANPRWWALAAPWFALYVMDRLYYHELLRASVTYARSIEDAGQAPKLCTALTRTNRVTLHGRVKVSLFYWLPLAGFSYLVVGGWRPWVLTAAPFVAVETFALVAHWIVRRP